MEVLARKGLAQFVSKARRRGLSFEFSGSCDVANAFRRCVDSEIQVVALKTSAAQITTDDKYVLPDEIMQSVNLVPIRQVRGVKFHLTHRNNSEVVAPIYSKYFSPDQIDGEPIMDEWLVLGYLRPGCSIDIHAESVVGTVLEGGASFSFPGRCGLEDLSIPEQKGGGGPGPTPIPEDRGGPYRLTIPEQQYCHPREIASLAIRTLISKVRKFASGDKREGVEILRRGDQTVVTVDKETFTLGNMIVGYCHRVAPDVPQVYCHRDHHTTTRISVTIAHPDALGVIAAACKKAISDLEEMLAALERV